MSTHANPDTIAIIGIAGRFPGADTVEAFWRNLCQGVESIRFFSPEELIQEGLPEALIKQPNYIPAKGMLEDIDQFDAGFFGYGPREAEQLDLQQRLFLECAWQALEYAGYDPTRYPGQIGLYASASLSSYGLSVLDQVGQSAGVAAISAFDKDFLSSRVAYHLDLRGPCVTVQCACSSSLAAVHYACQSLISGECDMVLAGGVSVSVPQRAGYLYQSGGIGSSDGHCRAFDRQADGTLNGDAVAVVVLRRLDDALAQRDPIHGLILGSAISNDGALRSGFSAPGVDGQLRAIRAAQMVAGVTADSIAYIEAHGTGTVLGDPIEVAALSQAFRHSTQRRQFCALGSVKTNIGHTDAAAGVVGLIKATLAVEHGLIPPSLNFQDPNPECDFEHSPFYVSTALTPWPSGYSPRRAGVSSFGMGGTNVHAIVQAPPAAATLPASPARPELIMLSARSETALQQAAGQLAEQLEQQPPLRLGDVAYTHAVGRRYFPLRRFVIADSLPAAARMLRQPARAEPLAATVPALYLHLPELPAECADQAWRSYTANPALAAIIEPLQAALPAQPHPAGGHWACLVQIALGQALLAWGVPLSGIWGQGSGCIAAAALAGLLKPGQALALAAAGPERAAQQRSACTFRSPRLPLYLGPEGTPCDAPAQLWHCFTATGLATGEPDWLAAQPAALVITVGAQSACERRSQRLELTLPTPEQTPLAGLLTVLGQLWCKGFTPDWTAFYKSQGRARVRLPAYPFQRQSYFLRASPPAPEPEPEQAPKPEQKQELSVPIWRQSQPLSAFQPDGSTALWLVFADAYGVAERIIAALKRAGQTVWRVTPGAEYRQQERSIVLVPDQPAHYQALAQALPSAGRLNILHGWALGAVSAGPQRFAAAQKRGLFSLLALVKTLSQRSGSCQLIGLGGPTERILGNESIQPEWATARAAVISVPWELPHWSCRWLDLEGAENFSDRLADCVLAEFQDTEAERLIAYRGQHRWRREFEPQQAIPRNCRLRQRGVYLITGAGGGIALHLAEYLFKACQARLIVIPRCVPGAGSPFAQRLADWQQQGQSFVSLPVELGQEHEAQNLRQGLQQATARLGQINGVFHLAGRANGGLISRLKPDDIWPELSAKALALEQLSQALPFEELDFVYLFSAHTALSGGLGQFGYAAANAYLDGVAQAYSPSAPVCSINWDRWQGIGMAQHAEALYRQLSGGQALPEGLSAEQGLALCEQLLRLPITPQVRVNTPATPAPAVAAPPSPTRTAHARPSDLAQPYEPPLSATEKALADVWQCLLGIEPIGRQDDFFDLGGHSLLTVQLLDDMRRVFQVELSLEHVFDAPTLSELAGCIEQAATTSVRAEKDSEFEEGSL